MRLLTIALIFVCASSQLKAQHVKTSLTQGIGLYSNSKKDSLFFAKQHYVTQLRVGYHYGRIGLIANVNYIQQQNLKDSSEDTRIPIPIKQNSYTAANISTIQAALGLELCVPIIKNRAQLNFYTTYGISISNSKPFVFKDSLKPVYSHQANGNKTKDGNNSRNGNMTSSIQAGFSFNYKVNKKVALKWQNEFNSYRIAFYGFDYRRTPTNYSGKQSKSLIISSLGVQYTF